MTIQGLQLLRIWKPEVEEHDVGRCKHLLREARIRHVVFDEQDSKMSIVFIVRPEAVHRLFRA
jgi:hypothetical protein